MFKNNRLFYFAITSVLSCPLAMADDKPSNGFLEDSHLKILNRNFFFHRDFRNGVSNSGGRNAFKPASERNGYAEEWAQGFLADYASGFTSGTLGFGIDAYSYLGVRLDTGGGRAGLRLVQVSEEGHPQDSFSKTGASVKTRLSKTTLRYGNLFPAVPVFSVNVVRLMPSSATGWMIESDDLSPVHLDAGYFTSRGGVDSSDNDDNFTTDYGLPIAIKTVTYGGAVYKNDDFTASFYGSEAKDTWNQYYVNLKQRVPLTEGQSLLFDFNAYRTLDTGRQLASVINNTTWSLSAAYRLKAHTLTLAYQKVDSDEPMDWVGFGTMSGSIYLANAVQYSTFTEPNERSVQLRYDLDLAAFGIPGLSFMTRYVRGDDIGNAHSDNTFYTTRYRYPAGSDTRHWERDIEARYVVQSGKAKDMSFRLRQATHRSSTGYRYPDINEVRLIVDYPLNIF
jgi:imipenem/basic amino acid-specific outer membrane pore